MNINEKLIKTRFLVDSGTPHIKVDTAVCATCPDQPCLTVCPVQCYQKETEKLSFSWENCVECGSCRVICPCRDAISWEYPRGGYGVSFRFG